MNSGLIYALSTIQKLFISIFVRCFYCLFLFTRLQSSSMNMTSMNLFPVLFILWSLFLSSFFSLYVNESVLSTNFVLSGGSLYLVLRRVKWFSTRANRYMSWTHMFDCAAQPVPITVQQIYSSLQVHSCRVLLFTRTTVITVGIEGFAIVTWRLS